MRDPMHTSVCTVCWRGTWYSPERIELPTERGKPFITEPERWAYGNKAHEHGKPGAMNLRPIDRSALASQFARYYESGERIRVRTTYTNGETWERTGTVGKTTGWLPVYLLMHRSNSMGSWDTLHGGDFVGGTRDEVIAVKRGRNYIPVRYG